MCVVLTKLTWPRHIRQRDLERELLIRQLQFAAGERMLMEREEQEQRTFLLVARTIQDRAALRLRLMYHEKAARECLAMSKEEAHSRSHCSTQTCAPVDSSLSLVVCVCVRARRVMAAAWREELLACDAIRAHTVLLWKRVRGRRLRRLMGKWATDILVGVHFGAVTSARLVSVHIMCMRTVGCSGVCSDGC